MNKVGRELGKIWEELEEGKNIIKVHCMKTLFKMKNLKRNNFSLFETNSCYVAQPDLKLMAIFLSQFLEC